MNKTSLKLVSIKRLDANTLITIFKRLKRSKKCQITPKGRDALNHIREYFKLRGCDI